MSHTHAHTSSAGFGTLWPALQCPVIRVQFSEQHVVVGDDGQEIFMNDVFVAQTDLCVLRLRDDLLTHTFTWTPDVQHKHHQICVSLTRTTMPSWSGPMVFSDSLSFDREYSHSRPFSMKVLDLVSSPLAFRMKLPVTWFFTADEHTDEITAVNKSLCQWRHFIYLWSTFKRMFNNPKKTVKTKQHYVKWKHNVVYLCVYCSKLQFNSTNCGWTSQHELIWAQFSRDWT